MASSTSLQLSPRVLSGAAPWSMLRAARDATIPGVESALRLGGERMESLLSPLIPPRRNVGVVGLYQSGKTTLLTSLISHLQHHDERAFPVGSGVRIVPPEVIETDAGFERFAFEAHRARLSRESRWPEKTAHISQYRALVRTDGTERRRARLTITDCPGERLADIPMVGRTFGEWSEWMIDVLRQGAHASHAGVFLATLDGRGGDADLLTRAYREALARLALDLTPIVSPSLFVLGERGEEVPVRGRSVDWLVEHRRVGLGEGQEFTPLDRATREAHPRLAALFERRFEAYREQTIGPLAKWMRRCSHLVVLVDVPMVLAAGPGMLRAHSRLIDQLLSSVDPGFSPAGEVLRRAAGAVGLAMPGVRKLTFVASKADQVHPDDHPRLDSLLRQLVRQAVRRHEAQAAHLDVEYFVVSAVRSADATSEGRLVARLDEQSESESDFSVSSVPEAWPADAWGEYRFARVRPRAPANEMYPPAQSGLHLVARSMLGLGARGGRR
ncbi:MAG: YcjX family protein [Planctomycetota bacterium]